MSLVWITGARGFIGRYLARYLAGQGHRVIGIGYGSWSKEKAAQWGVSFWMEGKISIKGLEQLQQVSGIPDEVFHLAGGSSVGLAFVQPYEDFNRTVGSTGELLEWQRRHAPAARLVAVSSAAVYGSGHEGAITEDACLVPFSPYGAHKLMMEQLCQSYAVNFGLKIVLIRLFSVYGPEIKKQLLWDLCGKLSADGLVQLGGTGQELRDWTHVCDVARALGQSAFLAGSKAPVLNFATGTATSIHDIATILASRWGGATAVTRLRFTGQSRAGDPFSLVADTRQIRSYGIESRLPVIDGIEEYVDWYRGLMMASL